MTEKRKIPFRRKLAYLAIVLLVCYLGLELATRTYTYMTGRGFVDNPRSFRSPFFTTDREPEPDFLGDRLVFRNASVKKPKKPKEIRIIFFGGSTTVNPKSKISYPEVLEQRLNEGENEYKIVCLNAASIAYSSAHTLTNFSLRCMEAQPDIICVYHNINDLSVNYFGDKATTDYGNKYKTVYYLGYRHRTGVLNGFLKMSRFARFVAWKFDAVRLDPQFLPHDTLYPSEDGSDTRDYETGRRYFERNLRSIAGVAKANGMRVVFGAQAARSEVRKNAGFAAYNETTRQVADEEDLAFVDVAGAVTDDDLFADPVHVRPKGVPLLAEPFYEPLKALVAEVKLERESPATSNPVPASVSGRESESVPQGQ